MVGFFCFCFIFNFYHWVVIYIKMEKKIERVKKMRREQEAGTGGGNRRREQEAGWVNILFFLSCKTLHCASYYYKEYCGFPPQVARVVFVVSRFVTRLPICVYYVCMRCV